MAKPSELPFYQQNAGVLLRVGQLELMVGLCIFFALLSLVVWRLKGRGISYFVSQFLSIAFIILVVGVLFERVASARLAHHMRAERGVNDSYYPELLGLKLQTPR